MASSKFSFKWLQLSSCPEDYPTYVFNTHPNEFIALKISCLKSYKYNVETDKFNSFNIGYGNKLGAREHGITYSNNVTFNEKDQMLFFQGDAQIDSINILTHEKK
eukprot:496754_1